MKRIYVIPTQSLPSDIGYLEIVAMSEEEVMQLPHELMTPFEFENEWNADIKGLFDSTKQFISTFFRRMLESIPPSDPMLRLSIA